jgi:hypothetical protein
MAHRPEFGAIQNYLDRNSKYFVESTGNWVPGDGNTLTRSTEFNAGPVAVSTLELAANNQTTASTYIENVVVPRVARGLKIRFHCLVRLPRVARVKAQLDVTGDGFGSWESVTGVGQLVQPDEWTLIEVVSDTNGNNAPNQLTLARAALQVTWETVDPSNVVFVRSPAVSAPSLTGINEIARKVYYSLPEYLWESDRDNEQNYPLYRFIDVLLSVAYDAYLRATDFRYIPPEDNGNVVKPSTLVDPTIASGPTLYWLAQLLGVDLIDPRTGLTSWDALMRAAKAVGLEPLNEASWEEWGLAIDADDPVPYDDDLNPSTPTVNYNLLQWREIENFDVNDTQVSPDALLNFVRWQVTSAAYGLRAGTVPSIRSAVSRVTRPGAPIEIKRHANGDPWRIEVWVDPTDVVGGNPDTVQEVLNPTTPAGYELVVVPLQ